MHLKWNAINSIEIASNRIDLIRISPVTFHACGRTMINICIFSLLEQENDAVKSGLRRYSISVEQPAIISYKTKIYVWSAEWFDKHRNGSTTIKLKYEWMRLLRNACHNEMHSNTLSEQWTPPQKHQHDIILCGLCSTVKLQSSFHKLYLFHYITALTSSKRATRLKNSRFISILKRSEMLHEKYIEHWLLMENPNKFIACRLGIQAHYSFRTETRYLWRSRR